MITWVLFYNAAGLFSLAMAIAFLVDTVRAIWQYNVYRSSLAAMLFGIFGTSATMLLMRAVREWISYLSA